MYACRVQFSLFKLVLMCFSRGSQSRYKFRSFSVFKFIFSRVYVPQRLYSTIGPDEYKREVLYVAQGIQIKQ